eukprot:GSChrysophyteH1.ASY1.ANO1.1781.1 assembled CDS
MDEEIYFEETVSPCSKTVMSIENLLIKEKSKYQDISVFENKVFGRVLTLDGVCQCTLLDEHIYHEMMAHVPMMVTAKSGTPVRVAIIGGGDGGVLREVVKYDHLEHCNLIDIDQRVIDLSKEFLPSISDGAFDHPKATILCQDGAAWFKEQEPASLDIVLIDSSDDDDDGTNSSLFTTEFYADMAKALKPEGIVVKQSGCNQMQLDSNLKTMRQYKKLFKNFGMYYQNVPTYPGGDMGFAWGTNGPALNAVEIDVCPAKTRHYHRPIHNACFALPLHIHNSIQDIRDGV